MKVKLPIKKYRKKHSQVLKYKLLHQNKLIKQEEVAMLNNQEYITTELKKILYEILPITIKRLKNLVYIIIGIILSKSIVVSDISEKLKDDFTDAYVSMIYL